VGRFRVYPVRARRPRSSPCLCTTCGEDQTLLSRVASEIVALSWSSVERATLRALVAATML
jgi:hypothetical protein